MAVWLVACGGDLCTAEGLQAALDDAAAEGIVTMDTCRVEGPVVVPAGVTLMGQAGSTMATASPRDVQVRLEDGARLVSVRIESSGLAAVVAEGAATLDTVEVIAERGTGLYAAGGALTLMDVTITGPVTADNVMEARFIEPAAGPSGTCTENCECEDGELDAAESRACVDGRWRAWTATLGVYLRGGSLAASGLDVAGFARVGVYGEGADVTWDGGSVSMGIGRGISFHGGTSQLTDVVVESIRVGAGGIPSYGVLATDGHRQTSSGLRVSDGERFGVVSLGAVGTHSDFVAERNGDVSLWVSDASQFRVDGDSAVRDGAFAGVVVAASNAVFDGLSVTGTRVLRRNVGTFGVQEIGDGLQVSASLGEVSLRGVSLAGNARVGLLTERAGVTFEDVSVDAEGDAFGALTGTLDPGTGAFSIEQPGGWDAEITRSGAAAANDAAASGTLDALSEADGLGVEGIIAPMY